MPDPVASRIHPSAIVEDDVEIGAGTSIWDSAHIRAGARIGVDCIVGEKTYIAGDVTIGDLCKLNAMVYVCAGVTIGHGVMVAAHTVFTNEMLPHAADPDITHLRHVTAEILHAEAQAASIRVSLATVYNTLHQFTNAGLLREIVVDSQRAYFDTNIADHHHFFFEGSNRLEDIPGEEIVLARLPEAPAGTKVTGVDVVIRVSED